MRRYQPDRRSVALSLAAAVAAIPLTLSLAGCDKTESKTKTTETRTRQTPEGTKTTTETTEKKVETTPPK